MSINARDAITDKILINKQFCNDNGIQYLSELIAQIISAKKIKSISIFTPFDDCELKCMSTDNYLAKVVGVSVQAGKYDFLLSAIDNFENRDELIEEIKNDLAVTLGDNIQKNIHDTMKYYIKCAYVSNMNEQIKYSKNYKGPNFNISYKNAAALMCGVFISEMIRTSAKFVRGAFSNSEWPKTANDLRKKFLQSNKQGNQIFRKILTHRSSEHLEVLGESLKTVSPVKKGENNKL